MEMYHKSRCGGSKKSIKPQASGRNAGVGINKENGGI